VKTGKLYVVGVGPGDPELLTLKGARLLREAQCICVPKGKEEGSSLALSIINKVVNLDGKEIIEAYFPMRKTRNPDLTHELDPRWAESVKRISDRLEHGVDVVFITLGDPTIYSTFFYLHDKLLEWNRQLNIEIIPCVSSINAAAARTCTSLALGDQTIALLPATYAENLKETIEKFDTVVLLKVHRVFRKVIATLNEMHLTERTIFVSRAGMQDERIVRDVRTLQEEDMDYFSLMIVRK